MGKINMGRVILGGLLAGLVINVGEFLLNSVLLGKEMAAATEALHLPPVAGRAIACFIVMGFALGIVAVWLYAAIRPRMGAGPKTAICAGLAVWALAYVYPSAGMGVMGMFTPKMLIAGIVWGFIEAPLGTLAGAWLYKEE